MIKELISQEVQKAIPDVIEKRHIIHQNPELSFEEYKTSELICKTLDQLNIEYESGFIKTGVLGIIRGNKPSDGDTKTVLIRADMDALPVKENADVPYCSKIPGFMHACGHDVHTSVLLCCAEVLNNLRDEFSGTIKLMFQPGEETDGGAKPMIDLGILENSKVDSCVALHVTPDLHVGQVFFKSGAAYASPDDFEITIKGRGGHAADPKNCIDPIVIAAEIVSAFQTIPSRMIDPCDPIALSVCKIHGGSAYNIIPDEVTFGGTARSFTDETRDLIEQKIEGITKNICDIYGAEYSFNFIRRYPPMHNDNDTTNKLKQSAEKYIDRENIFVGGNPTLAGEDFAYLTRAVKDSAMFGLGCVPDGERKYPLHNPNILISDECIKYGAEIFCDYTISYLNE